MPRVTAASTSACGSPGLTQSPPPEASISRVAALRGPVAAITGRPAGGEVGRQLAGDAHLGDPGAFVEQQQVGRSEDVGERAVGYRVEEVDRPGLRVLACLRLQRAAPVADAQEDGADRQPGGAREAAAVDDVLQALLRAHVPGVQYHRLVVAPPERAADGRAVAGGRAHMAPVADHGDPLAGDAETLEGVEDQVRQENGACDYLARVPGSWLGVRMIDPRAAAAMARVRTSSAVQEPNWWARISVQSRAGGGVAARGNARNRDRQ